MTPTINKTKISFNEAKEETNSWCESIFISNLIYNQCFAINVE